MGAFSRAKGSREERALVQHLKELGYQDVKRVPLSGAMSGFKGDVVASFGTVEHVFELKTRNSLYKWLYSFFDSLVVGLEDPVLRFYLDGRFVSIGYNPLLVSKVGLDRAFIRTEGTEYEASVARILRLERLKKGADFLVIKDNRRRRLFLKFYS